MTRIAVLSDIRGDSYALDAVLDAVSTLETDLLVNLGDTLSGAVDPRATAQTLRAHPELAAMSAPDGDLSARRAGRSAHVEDA